MTLNCSGAGDVVFDFGSGNILVLRGFGDLNALIDDLIIAVEGWTISGQVLGQIWLTARFLHVISAHPGGFSCRDSLFNPSRTGARCSR